MVKKFFITTPIYYSNAVPHIGHAYSSFIADVYARMKRLLGYDVMFSTGVDENSQKIVKKADEEGIPVKEFLDTFAQKHKAVRDGLHISYTRFIRTTEESHQQFVRKVLQQTFDKGDIYQGEYEGLYCVGCEAFKKESDLIEKDNILVCPDHLTPPDKIKEKNYFFKLSKYQQDIESLFAENPSFVLPQFRFNEIISFVKSGLEDFSVSRETNKFGIRLPFDESQVTYVWYDALLNYLTVCQENEQDFRDDDTEVVHVLGKDISRFHVVYRPAMLMSAGYRLPNKEIVTGYFTLDGQKISKSLGNVIDPVELIRDYDRDAVVFYLLYDIPVGGDGDFSWERFENMYHSMLIGGWGNLVNRVVKLCEKFGITQGKFDNQIFHEFVYNNGIKTPELINFIIGPEHGILNNLQTSHTKQYFESQYFDDGLLQKYLKDWYYWIQKANEFMQQEEPRKKFKDDVTKEEAICDLQFLLYVVKNLALLSAPFMINGFKKIQDILGNDQLSALDSAELGSGDFQSLLDMKEFPVDLTPQIVYQRKEG